MLKIIGTSNCSRCIMVKNILLNKNIEFEYSLYNDLSEIEKEYYNQLIKKYNQLQFPLIINKNEELINVEDIL